MAIGSGVPYNSHTGNGVTRTFAYGFTLLDAGDLEVTINGSPTSAYTVAGVGVAQGGSITFASPPAAGAAVLLQRVVALVRAADYQTNGDLQADTLNDDLDRIWMAAQQVSAEAGRSLRVPEVGAVPLLPRAAERANLLLGFDASGNPVAIAPVSGSAADLAIALAARRPLHALDYGAVGSGDETAQLKALFDAAIPARRSVVLRGNYSVSGPITSSSYASGSLHIICDGPVTITVDAGASEFATLLACYTPGAINDCTISGGRLTLNLAGRGGTGLQVRHDSTDGGTVQLGPVTVLNAKKLAADTNENGGVIVAGRYTSVHAEHTGVHGVERTAVGGACKGISISDVSGPVTLVAPQVSRVLCPVPSTDPSAADADGIAVFGRNIVGGLPGVYATRGGSLTMISPVITDCQGRSIKTQISQSEIVQPIINRQSVVAFSTSDIDHQVGGVHTIVNPVLTYRKAAGVSPVPSTWIPISLQHQCTDATGRMRVVGGTLRTEVAMERLCYLTVGASALAGEVEIADIEVQCLAGLTAPITRSVVEFDAGAVQASGGLHVSIRGLRGDFSAAPLLGYTGASSANTSRLSFDIRDNENTAGDGAAGAAGRVLGNLSGTVITQVGGFHLAGNAGFYDLLGTWNFDYLTLKAGCSFAYDRAASTVTNGPTLTGAYPRVEVLGSIGAGTRDIRVMEDTGAALVIHHRQAAAWRSVT